MVVSNEVITKYLIVHRIVDGKLVPSREGAVVSSPEINTWLTKFLFKPFNADEKFAFQIEEALPELMDQCSSIFNDQNNLLEKSIEIVELYLSTAHSNKSKDGEFIVAFFEDCIIGDEVTDVIGLFRIERKETFLKLEPTYDAFTLHKDEGISPTKIGQGAMIFNTDQESGYQILQIDKIGPKNEEFFWTESFLGASKVVDSYYHTQHLINNIQEFAQTNFDEDQSTEKITFVNDSIEFMKESEVFDQQAYSEQVLQAPELIEQFESFQGEKTQENPFLESEQFEISKPAIKSTKRYIRSVIKLDKNFHVYVHGNRENILRGYDEEKKKHFYTLYYEEET